LLPLVCSQLHSPWVPPLTLGTRHSPPVPLLTTPSRAYSTHPRSRPTYPGCKRLHLTFGPSWAVRSSDGLKARSQASGGVRFARGLRLLPLHSRWRSPSRAPHQPGCKRLHLTFGPSQRMKTPGRAKTQIVRFGMGWLCQLGRGLTTAGAHDRNGTKFAPDSQKSRFVPFFAFWSRFCPIPPRAPILIISFSVGFVGSRGVSGAGALGAHVGGCDTEVL